MKKVFLFLTIILSSLTAVHAQWKQTLSGQSSFINEVSVVNNNVIWVMGNARTSISYTLDGGVTWTTKPLPAGVISNSAGNLCAVNSTTAFIVQCSGDQKGVYKTTDSGSTWTLQTTGFNVNSAFPDFVYFWNENEGVSVGDANSSGNFEIYTTSNGGTQWNAVSSGSMPVGHSQGTWSGSSYFRVRGNSFYFMTSDAKIFKSFNKGLTWSVINTPATSTSTSQSFDFKDDNNGVLSFTTSKINYSYSTSDGGITWTKNIAPTSNGSIKYLISSNVYIATNYSPGGLSYSADNGQSWKNHPSFANVSVGEFGVSETGRIFLGGINNVFYSDNYSGENISLKSSKIISTNSIDIAYTQNADPITSKDISNYNIVSIHKKVASKINISSITQDQNDKSMVHLVMENNLPVDSISISIHGIYDSNGTNGNSLLYNGQGYLILLQNYNLSKTVSVNTPGTLLSLLTIDEVRTIQNLTLTGTIDARDFKIIRDSLQGLKTLDLSAVNIAAYEGTEGTYSLTSNVYPANATPQRAFYNSYTTLGKVGLLSVILPTSLIQVGTSTFARCTGLTSVLIPKTVTTIGQSAFSYCSGLNSLTISDGVKNIGSQAFYNCSGLTSLYSYPTTPVNLSVSMNVFSYMNFAGCILYVPAGTKTIYEASNQWTDFMPNIVEMTIAGTPNIQNTTITLFPNPTTESFQITGVEGIASITVSDLNGKMLLTKLITGNENVSMISFYKGVYIAKITTSAGVFVKKLVKN